MVVSRSLAFARALPLATARPAPLTSLRLLSTTAPRLAGNRVFPSVRDPDTLATLLLSTASSRTPLLTLWTASWCPTCRSVLPLVQRLVEEERVGEDLGGVAFVEVEYDAPGNEEAGMRYMINSVPTLLSFSRQEAQVATKVVKAKELGDKAFLKNWIEEEARRGGEGGAGGGGKGILGMLFGKGEAS